MSEQQQFGKWKVKEELRNDYYVARSTDGTIGFIKTGNISCEVNNLKKLDHPNIVRLLDYNIDAEDPFLVTEYHSLGHLDSNILNQFSTTGKVEMCKSISDAVEYCLSKNVKFQDSKLQHVLLSDDKRPVLVDFEGGRVSDLNKERATNLAKRNLNRLVWEIAGKEWVLSNMLPKAELLT